MTTYPQEAVREPLGARVARWRASALKVGAKALAKAWPHLPSRLDAVQLAGGGAASAGAFILAGVGVGLLVTGLAVLAAGALFESRTDR